MRRGPSAGQLLVAAAAGVASGVYIYKPLFEPREPEQQPPPAAPAEREARPAAAPAEQEARPAAANKA